MNGEFSIPPAADKTNTDAGYAAHAWTIHRNGLGSPLPLPPGCKTPPPNGYTGKSAPYASGADIQEWCDHRPDWGVVIRLADNVIGVDVDDYDGKGGAATLAAWEAAHGPLPTTVVSSSREAPSGIRWFRLPDGVSSDNLGDIGPGVEVIRAGWRYAVVAPSVHPEGRPYVWRRPDGTETDTPPHIDDLPLLPHAQVTGLPKREQHPPPTRQYFTGMRYDELPDDVKPRVDAHREKILAGLRDDTAAVVALPEGGKLDGLGWEGWLGQRLVPRGIRLEHSPIYDAPAGLFVDVLYAASAAPDWRSLVTEKLRTKGAWAATQGPDEPKWLPEVLAEDPGDYFSSRYQPPPAAALNGSNGHAQAADSGPGDNPTLPADEGKRSAAVVLVDLADNHFRFGVTDAGEPFAVPKQGGHVARMLRGGRPSLRAELASMYRKKTGKVAAQQALADALMALEGQAQDAEPSPVHLRVAEAAGSIWIDLGDTEGRCVRVQADRWSVVTDDVPVLFRRTALTGAWPEPKRGGDLGRLWDMLNVTEEDRPLLLAWLVSALLCPDIPHPILALFGEQGTGKTTCSRLLISLLDPSPVPVRKPPRDAGGWVTAAAGSYVVGLDNLSTVPDWLSDSLCRASTGEGDVRRQLYTDGGLAVFAFRRVLLLNGIDVGAMRGDLAERLLLLNLQRITERSRRTEHQMAAAWDEAYPYIVGSLLDLVAGLAGMLPSVRLDSTPRMADFARVLAALDQHGGTDGLTRFAAQAKTMAEDTLDADPFLHAMRSAIVERFEGTSAELRAKVTPNEDTWRQPRDWPRNARQVTSSLRRNAPALRKADWTVEDHGTANKSGVTSWLIVPPDMSLERAPISSPPSPPSPSAQVRAPHVAGKAGNGGEPTPADGGEAGMAGKEYRQSQDEPPTPKRRCPTCGTVLQPDGQCARCHMTEATA